MPSIMKTVDRLVAMRFQDAAYELKIIQDEDPKFGAKVEKLLVEEMLDVLQDLTAEQRTIELDLIKSVHGELSVKLTIEFNDRTKVKHIRSLEPEDALQALIDIDNVNHRQAIRLFKKLARM